MYEITLSWCIWWFSFPIYFLNSINMCLIISFSKKYWPCLSFKLAKSNQFKVDIKFKTGLLWNANMWLTNLPKTARPSLSHFQISNQIAKFNSWKLIAARCNCFSTILCNHSILYVFSLRSEWDMIFQSATIKVKVHSNF